MMHLLNAVTGDEKSDTAVSSKVSVTKLGC